MTDPLSARIAAQKSTAELYALRSWAERKGRWNDEYEKQYLAKKDELSARWR